MPLPSPARAVRSRRSSTTRAASASWPTCGAPRRTRSSRWGSRSCGVSRTAARPGAIPARATGPASSSTSRTPTTSGRSPTRASSFPLEGDYGVAQCFLSRDPELCAAEMRTLEEAVRHHNQKVIGWRDVPVDERVLGPVARDSMPVFRAALRRAHVPGGRLRAHPLHDPQARRSPGERGRPVRASTSRACRRRPSSTRACLCPSASTPSTSTSARRRRAARSPSSTRASARTRSPPGSARTRTAASRTTARSTRCAATRRGCARASRSSRARPSASTWPTSSPSSAPAGATRRRSTTWSTSSSPAAAACRT